MQKRYFIWYNKGKQFIGEAIDVNTEEEFVTLTAYKDETLTEKVEAKLGFDEVELFEVSPVKKAKGRLPLVDSLLQFDEIQGVQYGVLKKDEKDNWFVLLLQNFDGELSAKHEITIPFDEEAIQENNIEVVGHLKEFKEHVKKKEK